MDHWNGTYGKYPTIAIQTTHVTQLILNVLLLETMEMEEVAAGVVP